MLAIHTNLAWFILCKWRKHNGCYMPRDREESCLAWGLSVIKYRLQKLNRISFHIITPTSFRLTSEIFWRDDNSYEEHFSEFCIFDICRKFYSLECNRETSTSVIYPGFFGWRGPPKVWWSDFRGLEENLTNGQGLKFWLIFQKYAL